ncbi:beta/gamma crystallin-related protein [Fibrella aquatilis]|uniref:Beta/gamma crystallin 'Greek key' domain-containing protein n=1 Tax=Fibrella aquatilis TaxID=2817059 RepID=A0A939G7P2_9BACT|nr:beta/gamma crystallin-related protein [Fibrella aquatilis]MBO0933724.1 hypothetical protein [Fibrella aquatilis]
MKKQCMHIGKAMLSLLILLATLSAQAQVRFYTDPLFRGKSASFETSEYNTLGLGMAGNVSSVVIPNGYEVTIYDQPNLRGNSLRLTNNVPLFRIWNDRIQSARVSRIGGPHPPTPPTLPPTLPPVSGTDQVRIFDGRRYSGTDKDVTAGNHARLGPWTNRPSSVQVPRGYVVVLFDQPNFRGTSLRLAQNTESLADFGWDNRVQSMQVMQSGQPQPVRPQPVPVTRPLPSQRVN